MYVFLAIPSQLGQDFVGHNARTAVIVALLQTPGHGGWSNAIDLTSPHRPTIKSCPNRQIRGSDQALRTRDYLLWGWVIYKNRDVAGTQVGFLLFPRRASPRQRASKF